MNQKQQHILQSELHKNNNVKMNPKNQNLIQKPTNLISKPIQLEKTKPLKNSLQNYFIKPVIYNIVIFLNFKEITILRRLNSYFNQTYIQCLPILKQFYIKELNNKQEMQQSNIFYNQLPELMEIDFLEFRDGFQNEFLYTSPDIINPFYIQCIELITKVLLSELPKWRSAKFIYQMKAKLLFDKLKTEENFLNYYELTDKQVDIIRNLAPNFNFRPNTMKCQFCPLVDFAYNLIIITQSQHYQEVKKLKKIENRIFQIEKFLSND